MQPIILGLLAEHVHHFRQFEFFWKPNYTYRTYLMHASISIYRFNLTAVLAFFQKFNFTSVLVLFLKFNLTAFLVFFLKFNFTAVLV